MIHTVAAAVLALTDPSAQPDLSWMAGYWLDCANGREASEVWSDPRQGALFGLGVTIRGDRVGFEASHIAPGADGRLAYHAQPDGMAPTAFVLIDHGPGRAVYENPENDFPTRILYQRDGDTLKARIEGEIEGQVRSMEWSFQAAPLNTRCPG